ncbi:MAG: CDP-alcohol phosphatidyltransferase family protein [Rhizobiales bacterium]|nr:CDP-alcohol phosphatidyltransferase family protein [Hyphomicrobiales bacterium]
MASIYDIKPRFQALLRPVTEKLAAANVTANQVTVAAMALSIGHGLLIAFAPWQRLWLLLLPVTLFLRMALNAIDGMLAREHKQKSRLGAMLNELSDVISDAALYLPFALVAPLSPTLAVIAVVLAGLTEMTGVTGQTIGSTRRYDGPMGKSDRAFAYGLLAFLLAIGLGGALWTHLYQWAIVLLLAVTIWNRARKALQA